MKKIMIATLGLTLLSGTAVFAAQNTSTDTSTMKMKKKHKKSKSSTMTGDSSSTMSSPK